MGGSYAYEAADQYRMAGRARDALRMNSIAPLNEAQSVQRVAILFEDEHYAQILAIAFTSRHGFHRLAYAYYAVGDFAGD